MKRHIPDTDPIHLPEPPHPDDVPLTYAECAFGIMVVGLFLASLILAGAALVNYLNS